MTLSRRQFLLTATAAAIAPAIPALPASASPVVMSIDLASGPDLLAFAAGTEGEFDWQVFFGRTAEEALKEATRYFGYDDDDGPPGYFEFRRVDKWDHRGSADAVTGADWIRAGMGHICSRCSYETFADYGGHVVDEEVVCEECVTFADLLKVDLVTAEDELAEKIADEGAEDVQAWLELQGNWANVPPEIWAKAIERAAL